MPVRPPYPLANMKSILLLTHRQDHYTIDRVTEHLRAAGAHPIRLNTDRFPEAIRLSHYALPSGNAVMVHTETDHFSTREIDAVWHRKIWSPSFDEPLAAPYHAAAINESVALRTALFQHLESTPWLDPIHAVRRASDKYLQLVVAQGQGWKIPATLISNYAEEVRHFFEQLPGEMVAKLHNPLSYGMQSDAFFFYTTLIQAADLDELEQLQVCPMIFQERIPKAYELRVAYVDGQCFAGKLATQDLMDWRLADPNEVPWEAAELPGAQQQLLHRTMRQLNLSFGAVDLIVQPDGEYVFLEVNPVGEWGMLEKELDLPIARAIAEGLLQRIP